MKARRTLTLALSATLLAGGSHAADLPPATSAATAVDVAAENAKDAELEQVILTGSRQSGIKASESPAPIQVVPGEGLARTSSTPDLIQTLAAVVPSLAAATGGGDLQNITLQAALRSLSPNDTLVLVNGKRRHSTANLGVEGTGEFAGGAGADLNFIPAGAIDHIDVLTDGAAAQYGSDAIAGVINIILKKGHQGGNVQASYGAYQDGGGKTDDVTGNIGLQPNEGAWLNFTGEVRNHGYTVRDKPVDYITNPTATSLYPVAGLQPIDANVLNAPGWPIMMRSGGDAQYNLKIAGYNAGFRINDEVELYSFATWGQKEGKAIQWYRLPHIAAYTSPTTGETQYQYPYGFTPVDDIQETDYQITGGIRGVAAGWTWDLSSSYGRDYNDFNTLDSSNAILYSQTGGSPTNFYDGSFKATQLTNNLDIDRDFDVGLAGPLNLALGAEQRRDGYVIGAGQAASYQLGGGAAYQGFSTLDAGGHSRTNEAGYIDLAAKVIGGLRVDLAGRYEHYSDFGNAKSGKLTLRYDFTPGFALRGTISNGFRAPTVAEEYYTKSTTSPVSTGVVLAPDSRAAGLFGLGRLQPETSVNYSAGLVFHPVPAFSGTLDLYLINLDHRIFDTSSFYGELNGVTTSPLVLDAIAANGNQLNPTLKTVTVDFLANAVNTRTEGADLVLDYFADAGRAGKVDLSLKANYGKTTVTGLAATPASLAAEGITVVDPSTLSSITASLPKYNVQLGALWTLDRLSISLREIIHDTTTRVSSDNGATTSGRITYYTSHSGVIPITNVDIGYDVLKGLKLSVGAVNVFNRYPDVENAGLIAAYQKAGYPFVGNVYTSSPIGEDGGYYYLKATYTF